LIKPAKRKLSAKQLLADIRSGMDRRALKLKYALSDKALDSVCAQLAAKGALTEHEIRRLTPVRRPAKAAPEAPEPPQWRCPACNAPQAAEMSECPVCGVVVEKFVERQGQDDHLLNAASLAPPDAGPSQRTGLTPVIVSIVVFAFVGTCLLLWSTYGSKEELKISELDHGAQSQQQTGTEEDRTPDDSGELESVDKGYNEIEIGDTKDIVLFQPPAATNPQRPPERTVAVPREQAPEPKEETSAQPPRPKYLTGVLRQFSSGNFKKEVVEASKTYPVLFQFYSQT
jgi:hypothetical protein